MDEERIVKDDVIYGLMIKICAATKDSEKAKLLWEEMLELKELRLNCLHYNSLIKALGSRVDYADEAILIYDRMIEKKIQPDMDTFYGVLEAC